MSVSMKWTDKGATISTLNAVKEFPILTNEDVEAAIKDGRLETKEGSFMGKSYTKLLRHQVKKLVRQMEKKQKSDASSNEEEEEEEEEEKREPKWSDKGATISDKNAVKQFPGLSMDAIEDALKSGDLESRVGNFMGNAYRKLLLHQVERLVDELGVGAGGGGEGGDEETATSDKEKAKLSSSSSSSNSSSSSSSGRRKRLADLEVQLEEIEEKKRKLMKEKKKLEKVTE